MKENLKKLELNIINSESKKSLKKFQKYFINIGEQLGDTDSKGFHHSICEQIDFLILQAPYMAI